MANKIDVNELQQDLLAILIEDFETHQTNINSNENQKVKTDISFQEMAILGIQALEKQEPTTLSKSRAQAISVIMHGTAYKGNKNEEIKQNLKIYFPDLSEIQINDAITKLLLIYLQYPAPSTQ